MISPVQVKELATREQTTEINIVREYLQHLYLSHLYKRPGSEKFLFKGGTALRIVFGSPRYSEDLDFSIPPLSMREIEDVLAGTFTELALEGIVTKFDLSEAKETSGGHLAKIDLNILGYEIGIMSNIVVRQNDGDLVNEMLMVSDPPFMRTYPIVILATKILVREKVLALIGRYKPRDFFDLSFMLAKSELRRLVPTDPETIDGIRASLCRVSDKSLAEDLDPFVPISYKAIIKNLRSRLERQLADLGH